MSIQAKIIYFSFLTILLIPKVHASQASSTSSCSSSSAQSQTSAPETLFALIQRELAASNNNSEELNKIKETIKLANEYKKQGNRTLAITAMEQAYKQSTNFAVYHSQAAGNLGILLFGQDKHAQALTYLKEAYSFSHKFSHKFKEFNNVIYRSFSLYLGRIYLLDRGVKPNYAKALKFLQKAQKSDNTMIRASAKSFIGLIYLQGLGQQQDIIKARSYFLEALKEAQTNEPVECALNNLVMTLAMQLKQFDTFYQSIIEQQQPQPLSSTENGCKLKQAYAYLGEIKATQNSLPFFLFAILDKQIAKRKKQLDQLRLQIRQTQEQKIHNQEPTQTTTNNIPQERSVTTETKTSQAMIQSMFKEAVGLYETFLKEPTNARYQESAYALREIVPLILDDTKMRTDVMHMLNRIAEVYQQQKDRKTTTTTTTRTHETKQAQKWSLLDPFHQITPNASPAAQQRLNILQSNYLEAPDVKKLHGFINLWRTRVGTIRILYTVLPKAHAIGIIQIDDRKDVYENVEELQHREAWFYEPNLEARLKERAEQKA